MLRVVVLRVVVLRVVVLRVVVLRVVEWDQRTLWKECRGQPSDVDETDTLRMFDLSSY